MSADRNRKAKGPSRAALVAALREVLDEALPGLVEEALRRAAARAAGPTPSRRADPEALGRLLEAAHEGGRESLLRALASEPDLVAIALALDPVLGQKVRRWKDPDRTRRVLAEAILARAQRYDVFKHPG